MPPLKSMVWLVLLSLLMVQPGHALESEDCSYTKWRKIENLAAVLADHKDWTAKRGWQTPGVPGRANLCNADLRKANLEGADLRVANLEGADLRKANLKGADLRKASLDGAYLSSANLDRANLTVATLAGADLSRAELKGIDLTGANLEGANLSLATLEGANLFGANLKGAVLGGANLVGASLWGANLEGANLGGANLEGASLSAANLNRAVLIGANLEGADLREAKLEGANLSGAKLQEANLVKAELKGANLSEAKFQGANLSGAELIGADLSLATLAGADLREANLEGAKLRQTNLQDAKLSGVNLSDALFQPAAAPAQGYLAGLVGVQSVWFCPGEHSGLVQLRNQLKAAGLRELEREATFTLESGRTHHALARWNAVQPVENSPCDDLPERDRIAAIEGALRLVFFEWTTDYGLRYGRPILILLGLIGVFTLVYLPALMMAPKRSDLDSGIYRIWPEGRIKRSGEGFEAADDVIIEPLEARGIAALGLAFYFSVISAFHIGWRDLNVGSWIARMQPREYALRAKGWVRVVSGVQSLISVYLIAMWVLTYFSRPFE